MQDLKSPEQVRDAFRSHGMSVADWAREFGFTLPLVYAVLNGHAKGMRGESYKIAVALGIKHAPHECTRPPSRSGLTVTQPAGENTM